MSRYEIVDDAPQGRFQILDSPAVPTYNPTDGNSFLKNTSIGIGKGVTDVGLGLKQRFMEASKYFADKAPIINTIDQAIFGTTAQEQLPKVQAQVAESRELDAPLMKTGGGKVGNFVGKAIPAVGAAFIPGGQTLTGSVLSGAALGAAEPTLQGESVAKNATLGGLGGAGGWGLAKAVGAGVSSIAAKSAAKKAQNVLTDANTTAAREAGYAIPISQSNSSSILANTLDIAAGGRPKMAQAASLKNQPVTNALAAKAIGLPENVPLTAEALDQVRNIAFKQGYEPIANAGTITAGPAYHAALDNIVATTKGASNSFPSAVKNDIPALIDGLRVKQFDAGDALKMTQILRDQANTAYRAGDNALGKANKQAASALEDAIDTHLTSIGASDAVKAFRDARTLMAKTFTVEKALNSETGNVSAQKLAADLAKGKPLSGELLDIAKMGRLSPKNVQSMSYATPAASQLETLGSTGAAVASGNPLLVTIPYARSALRNTLLSQPAQRMANNPSYGLLSNMTQPQIENMTKRLIQGGAPAGMVLPGLLNFSE